MRRHLLEQGLEAAAQYRDEEAEATSSTERKATDTQQAQAERIHAVIEPDAGHSMGNESEAGHDYMAPAQHDLKQVVLPRLQDRTASAPSLD